MHQKPYFMVACGGTGGHLFPGLAVAQALHARGHQVTLCLSGRAIESTALPDWEGAVLTCPARAITPRRPLRALAGLGTLATSTFFLWRRWRRSPPAALLAMGSYASVAPVLAARLNRIPILLHEANAVPGRAVSRLSRLARRTCLSFADAAALLPGRPTLLTGMPVRATLRDQPPLPDFVPPAFRLLIMGGSQGAKRLNRIAAAAVERLCEQGMRDLAVVHLSGPHDETDLRKRYTAARLRHVRVEAFSQAMGSVYASVDLAICRAGAASCAELCHCGVPALLIPLPEAPRDHQTANARAMERQGAAICLPQEGLTAASLAETLQSLRNDPDRLAAMRRAALRRAGPDAADRIAEALESEALAKSPNQ